MSDVFPIFNLIEKYASKKQEWSEKIKNFNSFSSIHQNFKIGDKIKFIGGYENNMIFETEILGFDTDGDIYVLWDCYWFSIKNDSSRNIQKID
jgi:hypothetical protein